MQQYKPQAEEHHSLVCSYNVQKQTIKTIEDGQSL